MSNSDNLIKALEELKKARDWQNKSVKDKKKVGSLDPDYLKESVNDFKAGGGEVKQYDRKGEYVSPPSAKDKFKAKIDARKKEKADKKISDAEDNFAESQGADMQARSARKQKKVADKAGESHLKLVKALGDAGYRESALLLKNWREMDATAEEMYKSLEKTFS